MAGSSDAMLAVVLNAACVLLGCVKNMWSQGKTFGKGKTRENIIQICLNTGDFSKNPSLNVWFFLVFCFYYSESFVFYNVIRFVYRGLSKIISDMLGYGHTFVQRAASEIFGIMCVNEGEQFCKALLEGLSQKMTASDQIWLIRSPTLSSLWEVSLSVSLNDSFLCAWNSDG